ncbi:expressed unknown protein [Seminavis robusta]|uniref:RWD domain-containing protein n=1 Tax=Seminavis robusta TaxID=568900 RepID=A0A9N8EN87_9STRA|nr:expressed unknown protein [Seminavis robusta]|eukprot:Sro1268_g257790.1 n/a (338) ;mRNA; r:20756-21769
MASSSSSLSPSELLESLERTVAELEALEAIYGANDDDNCGNDETNLFQVVSLDELEEARRIIAEGDASVIPELKIEIACRLEEEGITIKLVCRLPVGYPEEKPAVVVSVQQSSVSNNKQWILHPSKRDALLTELNQTAESLVGAESVMTLVETLKELAPTYCCSTTSTSTTTTTNPQQQKIITNDDDEQILTITVISTHHLLDHAPDNYLAKGGTKHKLTGFYRFGTPGLAFCIGCDPTSVEHFQSSLEQKMPQKKFQVVLSRRCTTITTTPAMEGWQPVTRMEQIRQLLTPDEFTDILKLQGTLLVAGNTATKNMDESSTNTAKAKGKQGGNKVKK